MSNLKQILETGVHGSTIARFKAASEKLEIGAVAYVDSDGRITSRGTESIGLVVAVNGDEADVCINSQSPFTCPRCKSVIWWGTSHSSKECDEAMVHIIMDE